MNITRKPRIWFEHGVWFCSRDRFPRYDAQRFIGLGHTPLDAFNTWREGVAPI